MQYRFAVNFGTLSSRSARIILCFIFFSSWWHVISGLERHIFVPGSVEDPYPDSAMDPDPIPDRDPNPISDRDMY